MRPKVLAIVSTALILASVAESASCQCLDSPPGMISWWTADGTPADLMKTNHGTLQGGMGFVTGKVHLAFGFDGNDDHVYAGNHPSLRPGFPFSVDFWIYKDSPANFYGIACTDAGNNGLYSGFRVYVNSTGAVVTGIGNDLGCCAPDYRRNFFSSNGIIRVATWHHVAVVFESATSHLIYVDGSLQATTQDGLATSIGFGAVSQLEIGRIFDPNIDAFQYGKGKIDELGLHSGVLDPATIQAIFAADTDGRCRPLSATDSYSWGTIKAKFRNP